MIETTDEAVTYLEMVARRESGDLAEAALIVTRTLRQATQTLADHAQASGVREGGGAGVSDKALRRLAEKLYGEPALGIYAGLCRVAEEVAEEARREEQKRIEGIVREEEERAKTDAASFGVFAMAGAFRAIYRRTKGEER